VVVLDNLREGVVKADIYDPTLNPLYADVLKHYGVVGLPCRVGDPDRKGKVESGVGHAQKTPLKGTRFESLEGEEGHVSKKVAASFLSVIIQIILLDAVFSLDSVITAIGMVDQVGLMISAVVVAIAFMMLFAAPVGAFVARHPTIKMLALSFLLLIGLTLLVEAFDVHIPKGYIYFAMGFSVFVEMLNLRLRKKSPPVKLHERYAPDNASE